MKCDQTKKYENAATLAMLKKGKVVSFFNYCSKYYNGSMRGSSFQGHDIYFVYFVAFEKRPRRGCRRVQRLVITVVTLKEICTKFKFC